MERPAENRNFVRQVASSSSATLPEDLKERGVRRVAIFAWVVFAVNFVGTTIDHISFANTDPAWPNKHHVFDMVGSATITGMCIAMILVARSSLTVRVRVRAGVVYFVLLALDIAITDFGDGFWTHTGSNDHALHGAPFHAFIMVMAPVILPMSAWRTGAVAALVAGCGPVALWIDAKILDLPMPATLPMVQSFPFLMIPVATAVGHIVHRLGIDVKRARALGSYVLEDKIGGGGMGEVWRARHRFLARPAAVKLIRAELPSDTRRARFEREAQATAMLKSPHTVEVYEYGVSDAGEVFYVMELLDGFDLESLVERCGPQPAGRVVSWLRQACHSLHEAHEAGIVHRDIKPANMVVCRYGQDLDFLKVLDFGLAALGPSAAEAGGALTGDNLVLGTPAYMPPEMATGKSPVDARTDLYALGCVAYYAITGKRPFEGDSPVEVILGHVDKPPKAPSEVLGAPIPDALEQLILDCLAKAPDDRPRSAKEVSGRIAELSSWSEAEARAWWDREGAKRRELGGSEVGEPEVSAGDSH